MTPVSRGLDPTKFPPPPVDPTVVGPTPPAAAPNINPYNILPARRPSVLSPELLNRFRQFQALSRVLPAYRGAGNNNLPALLQWGLLRGQGFPTGSPADGTSGGLLSGAGTPSLLGGGQGPGPSLTPPPTIVPPASAHPWGGQWRLPPPQIGPI